MLGFQTDASGASFAPGLGGGISMEELDLDEVEKPQLFLHDLKSSGSNTKLSALC